MECLPSHDYPDLVNLAAHVIMYGPDDSILGEDITYEFPVVEPEEFKYLTFDPHAHSTPHKTM